MSFAAGQAARGLTVQQVMIVGLTTFAVANPEKFLEGVAKTLQVIQTPSNSNGQANHGPIVIHHTAPSNGAGGAVGMYMVKLAVMTGAVGWGSYMIFYQILPETAKGLLPVSTKTFKEAVSSLGKAVINLKDTLLVQIRSLRQKQDELGDQQQETHTEVLDIKDNVTGVRSDLTLVQEALTLCHHSLSESERRTSYIARGVQLLTRGVSTILPDDEGLMHELVTFNRAGETMFNPQSSPVQQNQLLQMQKVLQKQQQVQSPHASSIPQIPSTASSSGISQIDSDPENAHPMDETNNTIYGIFGSLGIQTPTRCQ